MSKSKASRAGKNTNDKASPQADKPKTPTFWLGVVTLLLVVAYLVPGLTGHAPVTQDEANTFGVVSSMLETGDVIVPKLDGEPFVANPPAYYLTAAGIAKALDGSVAAPPGLSALGVTSLTLPPEDAARLATGLYALILFGFTVLLGRAAWVREGRNEGQGAIALLVLIGTLGLLLSAHTMTPEIALAAGVAMALYGLAIAPRRVLWGGVWLGTGIGLAFLSKGLLGPAILAVSALLVLLFRDWRSGRYLRALIVALIFALPWLVIWPYLLFERDPALFHAWLWDSNLTNYMGNYLSGEAQSGAASAEYWLRTWPWVTFPASILAVLSLVFRLPTVMSSNGVRAALVVSVVGWLMLLYAASAQYVYALPLLAPLAVVGVGAVTVMPRWVARPVHLLSFLLFAAAALLLWGLWGYHMLTGQPYQSELLAQYVQTGGEFAWQPIAFVGAALLTLLWFWVAMKFRRARAGALMVWPAGVVLLWGLVSLLHQPWLESVKI
jgi:4-amino-4-deoxy-L-arabinose transferase-like glycosyltransferase